MIQFGDQKKLMKIFMKGAKAKIKEYQQKAGMPYRDLFKEFHNRVKIAQKQIDENSEIAKEKKQYESHQFLKGLFNRIYLTIFGKILKDLVKEANITIKELYDWVKLDRIVNENPNGMVYCLRINEDLDKGKCFFCQFGHMALDCHYPFRCESEFCEHYRYQWDEGNNPTKAEIEEELPEEF